MMGLIFQVIFNRSRSIIAGRNFIKVPVEQTYYRDLSTCPCSLLYFSYLLKPGELCPVRFHQNLYPSLIEIHQPTRSVSEEDYGHTIPKANGKL